MADNDQKQTGTDAMPSLTAGHGASTNIRQETETGQRPGQNEKTDSIQSGVLPVAEPGHRNQNESEPKMDAASSDLERSIDEVLGADAYYAEADTKQILELSGTNSVGIMGVFHAPLYIGNQEKSISTLPLPKQGKVTIGFPEEVSEKIRNSLITHRITILRTDFSLIQLSAAVTSVLNQLVPVHSVQYRRLAAQSGDVDYHSLGLRQYVGEGGPNNAPGVVVVQAGDRTLGDILLGDWGTVPAKLAKDIRSLCEPGSFRTAYLNYLEERNIRVLVLAPTGLSFGGDGSCVATLSDCRQLSLWVCGRHDKSPDSAFQELLQKLLEQGRWGSTILEQANAAMELSSTDIRLIGQGKYSGGASDRSPAAGELIRKLTTLDREEVDPNRALDLIDMHAAFVLSAVPGISLDGFRYLLENSVNGKKVDLPIPVDTTKGDGQSTLEEPSVSTIDITQLLKSNPDGVIRRLGLEISNEGRRTITFADRTLKARVGEIVRQHAPLAYESFYKEICIGSGFLFTCSAYDFRIFARSMLAFLKEVASDDLGNGVLQAVLRSAADGDGGRHQSGFHHLSSTRTPQLAARRIASLLRELYQLENGAEITREVIENIISDALTFDQGGRLSDSSVRPVIMCVYILIDLRDLEDFDAFSWLRQLISNTSHWLSKLSQAEFDHLLEQLFSSGNQTDMEPATRTYLELVEIFRDAISVLIDERFDNDDVPSLFSALYESITIDDTSKTRLLRWLVLDALEASFRRMLVLLRIKNEPRADGSQFLPPLLRIDESGNISSQTLTLGAKLLTIRYPKNLQFHLFVNGLRPSTASLMRMAPLANYLWFFREDNERRIPRQSLAQFWNHIENPRFDSHGHWMRLAIIYTETIENIGADQDGSRTLVSNSFADAFRNSLAREERISFMTFLNKLRVFLADCRSQAAVSRSKSIFILYNLLRV